MGNKLKKVYEGYIRDRKPGGLFYWEFGEGQHFNNDGGYRSLHLHDSVIFKENQKDRLVPTLTKVRVTVEIIEEAVNARK